MNVTPCNLAQSGRLDVFAEQMTTDEKALCKWRHALREVAAVAPGCSLRPQEQALPGRPSPRVNHPQTYPAVGSLLLRERILEPEDSHILNLSQETLSP